MSFELLLDTPRKVPTPYPVFRAGRTQNQCPITTNHYFQDRLEICFRISAEDEFAVDRIDGQVYKTPFPHLFFKYPFHHLQIAYNTPRSTVHFSYSLETLEKLRKNGILPPEECFFLPFRMNDEIRHLAQRLSTLLDHTLERKILERVDLTAFELLTECLMTRCYPEQKVDAATDKLLAIASILRQSFRDYPDFSELARKHGMSLRTLFRHWSSYFGETPAQFVQDLKITEAAKLLQETTMPIGAIAATVALGDASYFSKIFRKHFNMTPGEFRKNKNSRPVSHLSEAPRAKLIRIW